MVRGLPDDASRNIFRFCASRELAQLSQTRREQARSVGTFVIDEQRALGPTKKRVRMCLRGLAYLQAERRMHVKTNIAATKAALQQASWLAGPSIKGALKPGYLE